MYVFSNSYATKKELRMEAVRALLSTLEPNREGLEETPDRVARMYEEIFQGYDQDPKDFLRKRFKTDHQEMVIVKDIPVWSHCEHHMVPFVGVCHIGYIPQGEVIGLSKLVRLVNCFARRLQIQEQLTSQLADILESELRTLGVAVLIEAEHMCMTMRGVKAAGTKTVTTALRGLFKLDEKARMEFLTDVKR